MIVEMRTYAIIPGKVADYYKFYEAEGLEVQKRILGNLIGYFSSEFGELNQIVHLWGYSDLNDRAARRKILFADPQWLAYLPKIMPLIKTQVSTILTPAPFSPIK